MRVLKRVGNALTWRIRCRITLVFFSLFSSTKHSGDGGGGRHYFIHINTQ